MSEKPLYFFMSRTALNVHFHIGHCQFFNPIDQGGGAFWPIPSDY